MAKIRESERLSNSTPKEGTYLLDKLAQLGKPNADKGLQPSETHKKYLRKARKKAIGYAMATELLQVENSPLHKSYKSTLYCSNILLQEGNKIHSKACKQRWCNVCNGIKTADYINGYMPSLNQLGKLYFVTLTIKSVPKSELRETISQMLKVFRSIHHDTLRKKYGIRLDGIRKIECNYNAHNRTFNPHFHIVASTGHACELLLLKSLWLNAFPSGTHPEAQDIKKADEGSLMELFKYATKPVTKGEFNPYALDTIYTAFKGKRLVQPFGGVKKVDTKEQRPKDDVIDFQPSMNEVWGYDYGNKDWLSSKGKPFTGYKPDSDTSELLQNITKRK